MSVGKTFTRRIVVYCDGNGRWVNGLGFDFVFLGDFVGGIMKKSIVIFVLYVDKMLVNGDFGGFFVATSCSNDSNFCVVEGFLCLNVYSM